MKALTIKEKIDNFDKLSISANRKRTKRHATYITHKPYRTTEGLIFRIYKAQYSKRKTNNRLE